MKKKTYLFGIAGGSGSGKTYFSRALQACLGEKNCEIVFQDNFYIDQSDRFDFDGGSANFDHPESIDFDLLASCLKKLKAEEPVQIPIYDFVTHTRRNESIHIYNKPIIIVDGILIFHAPQVRELFDHRIFFDTPETIRYQRRLGRDVKERGRTPEGVYLQFVNQVKPMHDQFVEPSKSFAHRIVYDEKDVEKLLEEAAKLFL